MENICFSYIWSKILSSSLDTLLKLSKTSSPPKLFHLNASPLYSRLLFDPDSSSSWCHLVHVLSRHLVAQGIINIPLGFIIFSKMFLRNKFFYFLFFYFCRKIMISKLRRKITKITKFRKKKKRNIGNVEKIGFKKKL